MSVHLGSDPSVFGQILHSSSATPAHALGTRATSNDGRVFRYVKAGAVDLVAGNALQSPATVANHQNVAPAAAAVGDTQVTVTLGATAATAGQYAGGLLLISTTPGNGFAYRIAGHPAANASATLLLTLEDPIQVALTTSSRCDLVVNSYNGVIQTPVTTLTGAVVGGAVYPVTAAQYGWAQVRGAFPGLIDGTPAVGMALSCPAAVAGGFAINSSTLAIVGFARLAGVDTKNKAIELTLE